MPNAPADIALPDAVRTATERVTADKVADGVWFIAGGSHNSVAIEMKDYMILVETPLNDGRSLPVFEEVKKLAHGKPIRYVVNSHAHFDHSGGLRTAAGEGATIITQAQNKAYFERALATPSTIAPDHLQKSGKKARIETVGEKMVLRDGTRTVEIYRVADSHHTRLVPDGLPAEGEAPDRGGLVHAGTAERAAARGRQVNPNNTNLVENLERMNSTSTASCRCTGAWCRWRSSTRQWAARLRSASREQSRKPLARVPPCPSCIDGWRQPAC